MKAIKLKGSGILALSMHYKSRYFKTLLTYMLGNLKNTKCLKLVVITSNACLKKKQEIEISRI